jgi:hypothetical protein
VSVDDLIVSVGFTNEIIKSELNCFHLFDLLERVLIRYKIYKCKQLVSELVEDVGKM